MNSSLAGHSFTAEPLKLYAGESLDYELRNRTPSQSFLVRCLLLKASEESTLDQLVITQITTWGSFGVAPLFTFNNVPSELLARPDFLQLSRLGYVALDRLTIGFKNVSPVERRFTIGYMLRPVEVVARG